MQARKPPPRGRPKSEEPNKKPAMTYLRPWALEWMEANLPRGQSNSAFIAEAVEEKIRRLRR